MSSSECLVVLVVDDHDGARMMLAEYLELAAGFRVLTAEDGRQAIDVTRRLRPGVIVMDLAMPVMDGVTAIRALRADPETRGIPIVVLTAFEPRDEAVRRALEVGCAEVLTKPVDVHLLERCLRYHCAPLQALVEPPTPDPGPPSGGAPKPPLPAGVD